MGLTVRRIIVGSIPTVVALLGFLWFRRKKKDPVICWENDSGDLESVSTEAQTVQRLRDTDSLTTKTVLPVVAAGDLVLHTESTKPVSCDDAISTSRVISNLKSKKVPEQTASDGASCSQERYESPVIHLDKMAAGDFVSISLKGDSNLPEITEDSIKPDTVEVLMLTPPIMAVPVVTVSEAVTSVSSTSLPAEDLLPVILVSNSHEEAGMAGSLAHPAGEITGTEIVSTDQTTGSELTFPCQVTSSSSPVTTVEKDNFLADYSHTNGHHTNDDPEHVDIPLPKDASKEEPVSQSMLTDKPTMHSSFRGGDTDQISHSDITDVQSEVSSDSGRGASGIETPTATSPSELSDLVVYEFDFPTDLCGKLIGKAGKNINGVKAKTGAEIILKRKPFIRDYQNCCIEGTQAQVQAALENIRRRFPTKQYNTITYKQTNIIDEAPMLAPEIMQLSLPVGVSVDCVVSSVVQANHIFVQQPTHPTFSSLESLNYYMNGCYSQDNVVPQLPRPIDPGVICAAPVFQGWYRAQVMAFYADTDETDIKYVDYGGYMRVPAASLRQIRSDFATLPFQAVECYLANVMPLEDQEEMSLEASVMLESLVQGQMLQAQITEHEADGVPYVQLYNLSGTQAVFINRELVDGGVARWVETQG